MNVGDLTITGGNAADGGGIFNEGTATVTNCHVTANLAIVGGGIASHFGALTLRNSTVSNNSAEGEGGGVWHLAVYEPLHIDHSTISGNLVSGEYAQGGGIWVSSLGQARILNSTVTDNYPTGLLALTFAGIRILSSIIAANRSHDVLPDADGEISDLSEYNLIGNLLGLTTAR